MDINILHDPARSREYDPFVPKKSMMVDSLIVRNVWRCPASHRSTPISIFIILLRLGFSIRKTRHSHIKPFYPIFNHVKPYETIVNHPAIEVAPWRAGKLDFLYSLMKSVHRLRHAKSAEVAPHKLGLIPYETLVNQKTNSGWRFEPLWKILANWDDYSQYMGK